MPTNESRPLAVRPEQDLAQFIEIADLSADLQKRALNLYVLDPAQLDRLREIFAKAGALMAKASEKSILQFACPAGTVECSRGCCWIRSEFHPTELKGSGGSSS